MKPARFPAPNLGRSRGLAMLDDEIPDNDWDAEVRLRVLAGEDEETVRAEVIKRYLNAGVIPAPLFRLL